MNFKFTTPENKVVSRTFPDGRSESCSVKAQVYLDYVAAGGVTDPADPPPAPIDLSDINNMEKALKAFALMMRDYTNALQAGTHTQKTLAQFKADFKTKWDGLP